MYQPVHTECLSSVNPQKYLSFTQISTVNIMDLDNRRHGDDRGNNNNVIEDQKPSIIRRFSLRNSFSGDNPSEMRTGTGDFYVDIDHIHLGLTNSISKGEPSIADAEVQTTHLVPYRLRLWPKTDCDFKLSPAETSCSLRCKCCLQVFSQWLLSQAGLTLILFIWALLGAFAFYNTEGPREQKQSQTLATIQRDLSRALATELNQTENHLASWSSTIHKYFEKHELLFLEAVGAGYGEGGGGNIWTYPGCILFSVSLLTTLGFGAPVPRTPLGRGAAVLFALVGIPLHFLLVLNVGNLTAIKIQKLAFKTDIPNVTEQPRWLNWFPFIAILVYYILGVVLFGFVRERDPVHAFMFPLDFTASGGVANVPGAIRIFYALYLEVAVTLAALVVSLIQASAGTGIVDVGLRWGLLTNT
ncbi:potassium channel subfamily K member 6-like isoform X1 [Euwallacea similis]|uniref:potassium channel subfamily K member 6-like isoform X1 n=1 Tax=Euwallacea similis TaxID=1736056 RepID=UPI00344DF7CD